MWRYHPNVSSKLSTSNAPVYRKLWSLRATQHFLRGIWNDGIRLEQLKETLRKCNQWGAMKKVEDLRFSFTSITQLSYKESSNMLACLIFNWPNDICVRIRQLQTYVTWVYQQIWEESMSKKRTKGTGSWGNSHNMIQGRWTWIKWWFCSIGSNLAKHYSCTWLATFEIKRKKLKLHSIEQLGAEIYC